MSEIRRTVRRQVRRPGVEADLAADLNVALATDGEHSTSTQRVQITQRAGRTAKSRAAHNKEER
jgi:hypothetical protein